MEKKYCIVPQCYNSTVRTPGKLFFYVPDDPIMRKKWMTAAKRVVSIGPKTKAHCCEDHFDVENDMENYVKYKLVGGKLKLKKGVVPHKFDCHKQSVEKPKRTFVKKLKIAKLTTSSSECIATTSHDVEKIYIVDSMPRVQDIVNDDPLKDVTTDENLCSTTEDILETKHKKICRGSFLRLPSHLLAAPKQHQRTPAGLFSCNNETHSGDDKDDSIYERDVSRNKTECDETQSETDITHNETDRGDDRVHEDDSIYDRDVSPTKAEDDDDEATVPEGSSRLEGCRCDVCRGDIVGFRYACVQCDNFDLCGACEARGEHATHYVLRIPPNKLHSDVQAVIERIREQLLEEYTVKLEVKEEVIERDPLEETTSAEADNVQETSCQDTKREESEDTDVNLLDTPVKCERDKQPVFEVSPSYPPSVPQVLSQQSKVLSHQSKVLSHRPNILQPRVRIRKLKVTSKSPGFQSEVPQVLPHQPKVLPHQPKVLSHQPNILIRQPRVRIRKLKVTSKTPEVQSEVPQIQSHLIKLLLQPSKVLTQQPNVLSKTPEAQSAPQVLPHQSQVAPSATIQEKRRLMLEEQTSTSEELNPARKKRKELNLAGKKRKELNPASNKRKELNPAGNKRKVLNPKSKKRKELIV